MHRKSLEAAHQLTSGDESNKEDDEDNAGARSGGGKGANSSGDEREKRDPAAKKQHQHNAHNLIHSAPATSSSETSSYMTSYAGLHGRSADDFRMSSVAELRAKAAEHQARIAGGFSVSHHHHQQLQQLHHQQQQMQQRDGEFLISSDSSSSSF